MMSIKDILAQSPEFQNLIQGRKMYQTIQIETANPKTLNHAGQIQQVLSDFPGEVQRWRHSLAILVPGTVDVNVIADTSVYLHEAAKLMSESFGGTRIWSEIGTYVSDTVGLVTEQNVWVKSHMDEPALCQHFFKVFDFVCQMRDALRQEAMLLEIDGDMYCLNWYK